MAKRYTMIFLTQFLSTANGKISVLEKSYQSFIKAKAMKVTCLMEAH